MKPYWLVGILGALVVAAFTVRGLFTTEKISYNQHIRPIFNAKCITCHGGIKQSGGFSLLFREDALGKAKSGKYAIVPGHADESELIKRLVIDDPELRMPLEHEPLTKQEIDLISNWIDQGAEWEDHWAYIPPDRSITPPNTGDSFAKNGIDRFVYERLQQEGLSPSPEADRATLLRRVSLDLTGLPPTTQQAAEFMADKSPNAYEKLVDKLIQSPHFGERWASMWLDLARYADSKGYEKDLERSIWLYRDWVIRAFNQDMPFDRFTVEQLAGDLLPAKDAPTADNHLIATAFHRNTMSNDEGGTNDEEFRNMALIDRVSTTWEVWQGTTMACVQCHSHPYDPIRHEEFYKFFAYFNNSQDADLYNEKPKLYTFTPENEQKVKGLMTWIQTLSNNPVVQSLHRPLNLNLQRQDLLSQLGYRKIEAEDFDSTSRHIELYDNQTTIMQTTEGAFCSYNDVDLTNVSNIVYRYTTSFPSFVELHLDRPDGPLISRAHVPATQEGDPGAWYKWKTFGTFRAPIQKTVGRHALFVVFHKDKEFRSDLLHMDWLQLEVENAPINRNQTLRKLVDSLALIPATGTPVILERPASRSRKTNVFIRGNWLTKGKQVNPDVPHSIRREAGQLVDNRLAMARWMVSQNNPLTARVMVNRFWEQLFGYGLVETLEDFGTMGAKPTHPELLDWLAVRFQDEYKWSVKKLLRDMVLSATYRQSAVVSPELQKKDPRNLLLARGPRVRLTAEQIRDQALAVSGLLNNKLYGPSVRPFNPTNGSWKDEQPDNRHRRALYTFWQRTNPYPSMVTFDTPQRNLCVSRRVRTNTPLQALITLNDTVYTEAAHGLASLMSHQKGDLSRKLTSGYEQIMYRKPSDEKLALLEKFYLDALHLNTQKKQSKTIPSTQPPEFGALSMVANVLLNLDETLTK
ncbi:MULTISPECIES: DUF1553 domain-containing protein [unclassified Spirosoma]|uniref:DUF1553 domain-containing protein n=1 Tax=unclassified Spirosoma TaxID=2621999 RepID=UPI000959A7F4|nr:MULTISPECIES: DUF1553 domain-containing protein [unclassified Spirosoma]MBN8821757.1 DUF1553 domain-containing protein [Spirosoma sp.]OJW80751.1 MAG: hypothetical protein BGO59_35405 [Spirosoma sp. 48-14]